MEFPSSQKATSLSIEKLVEESMKNHTANEWLGPIVVVRSAN